MALSLFDTRDRCSGQMFPGLVVTCFFVSLPWTHFSCWRIFVQQRESCDINLRFRQWLVAIHVPINHRWSPLRVHQDLLLFDSGVSSLQQHGSDTCSLSWYFRHFCRASRSGLGSRTSSLPKVILETRAWGSPPAYTQQWITASIPAIFSLYYMDIEIRCLFFCMTTSFDTNLFTWVSDGGIVSRLSVSAINRSTSPTSPPLAPLLPGLKAVPMNIPRKAVVPKRCTRLWSWTDWR